MSKNADDPSPPARKEVEQEDGTYELETARFYIAGTNIPTEDLDNA